MKTKFLVKKDYGPRNDYLVLADEEKYEWGSKEDAVEFDLAYADEMANSFEFPATAVPK